MLSVVTYKWRRSMLRSLAAAPANPARARRPKSLDEVDYSAEHVNRLRSMVARHLDLPHRFLCVTDDPAGLGPQIEVVPMWPGDEAYYRCTRRLRMFSKDAREALGDRVLHLDLDTVIIGDLMPLALRTEPLAVWWATSNFTPAGTIDRACNPSVSLFTPGVLDDLWHAFQADPEGALSAADRRGWHRANSDQCVLSDWLHEHPEIPVAKLGEAEGLYSFRDHILPSGWVPRDARLIGFYDPRYDPADPALQAAHPFIAEHWRC